MDNDLKVLYDYYNKKFNSKKIGCTRYRVKEGRWELILSLGFDDIGKRIRKFRFVMAKDKNDALNQLKLFALEYKDEIIRTKVIQSRKYKIIHGLLDFCHNKCMENCFFKNKKQKWCAVFNIKCNAYKYTLYRLELLDIKYNDLDKS